MCHRLHPVVELGQQHCLRSDRGVLGGSSELKAFWEQQGWQRVDDGINPCVGLQNKEVFANKTYEMVCGAAQVFCTPRARRNTWLPCKGWENQNLSAVVLGLLRHHLPVEMLLFPRGCAPAVSHGLSRRNSSCVVLGFRAGLDVAVRGSSLGESQLKWWELLSECFCLQLSALKRWDAAGWVVQSQIPQPQTVVPLLGELPAGFPPAQLYGFAFMVRIENAFGVMAPSIGLDLLCG